jgi:aspartyl-tRNA(Asn)/glutamyl-tRNA(Gln) amidotransferase subunit A
MGILANVGPMARSVADCALMLRVIAGTDARDPYRLPPSDEDYGAGVEGGVRGLRIAYSADLGYAEVDPDVRAAVDKAVGELAETGAHVEAVDPGFPNPRDAFMTLWTAGAARMLSGLSPAERQKLDPGLAASVEHGAGLSAVDYLKADAERTELGRRMGEFFGRYDLLATPTVAIPAPPAGQDFARPGDRYWVDWTPFSYPFNMTRQPAATVPCGLSRDGLPIGLQLVGPLYAEATVLRAARAYESRHPFRRPPPLG